MSTGWRSLYQKLLDDIQSGHLPEGAKLPSETDLALDMGASKATIHRALKELAADGHLRRVPRVGTFVSPLTPPGSCRFGLVLPTTEGFLEIKYISGIRDVLNPESVLTLQVTDNDPVKEYRILRECSQKQLDALIILPCCHPETTAALLEIDRGGLPVVCIDREPVGSGLRAVTSNNYDASRAALAKLAERGHRRLGYFGFHAPYMSTLVERSRAFTDHMAQVGEASEETIRLIEPRGRPDFELELRLFEDAILRLTHSDKPITSAFCANEHYLAVLHEILPLAPQPIQEKFEVVAFCDWPRLSLHGLRTHVVRQDARAIGKIAAQMALGALEGRVTEPRRVEVPCDLDFVGEADFQKVTLSKPETNGGNP